jgi:hypothetical protein
MIYPHLITHLHRAVVPMCIIPMDDMVLLPRSYHHHAMEEVVEVAEATAVVPIITEGLGKHNTMMIKHVGETEG